MGYNIIIATISVTLRTSINSCPNQQRRVFFRRSISWIMLANYAQGMKILQGYSYNQVGGYTTNWRLFVQPETKTTI